jgi:esterase/lipase superfamily enzyme
MVVVSTRAPSDRPGQVYSGRRGVNMTMARIDVSIPPNHQLGHIEWPEDDTVDPSREFATLRIQPVDPPAVRAWFEQSGARGHVLIYVHGFNVPFDGAVYRLAQLTHDSGATSAPVLFTWPSLGSIFAYVYDRESAAYSRDALEAVLRLTAQSPDVEDVTILAHSMGTWLTIEALRQYAIRHGRVDAKISNVILASPDLDADVFRTQFMALGDKRPNFTFLIARDDRALLLSRLLAAGVTRVGAADVTQEPYRSALARVDGVTVVDMTDLSARDRSNHMIYAQSPEAVRVLSAIFMTGEAVDPSSGVDIGARIGGAVIVLAQSVTTAVTDPAALAPAPAPQPEAERVTPLLIPQE